MGHYTFTVQIHVGQHHNNIITAIRETQGCSSAFLCGQIIRVDINNISEIKAEAFRSTIIGKVVNNFSGNNSDVSTLFPTTPVEKSHKTRLSKKNKKILTRATLFGSLIFLVVFFSLIGFVNPINPIPPERIIEASLGPAAIAFVTELIASLKE